MYSSTIGQSGPETQQDTRRLQWPPGYDFEGRVDEPGDFATCVKCFTVIRPGQTRKPSHRSGHQWIDEPLGFRHKQCDPEDLAVAREIANACNTSRQKARSTRKAPYTNGHHVAVTNGDKVTRQRPYKRSEISAATTESWRQEV